jgi:hypothetical protein
LEDQNNPGLEDFTKTISIAERFKAKDAPFVLKEN